MKILAFNGSPRKADATTQKLIDLFFEGARQAGADTHTLQIADLKIRYCSGCFQCWFVHPGRCIHRDDMRMVRDRLKEADIWVFATPLYVDGVSAQLKTVMDRMIPAASPFVEMRDGHMRHPMRKEASGRKKTVFICNCGFGEADNFAPVVQHMQAAFRNMNVDFLGALLRPMGPIFNSQVEEKTPVAVSVCEAYRQAGRAAAAADPIAEDTLQAAAQPFMDMAAYLEHVNKIMAEFRNRETGT